MTQVQEFKWRIQSFCILFQTRKHRVHFQFTLSLFIQLELDLEIEQISSEKTLLATFHRVAKWNPGFFFFFEGSHTFWKRVHLFTTHQLEWVLKLWIECLWSATSRFCIILKHLASQVFRFSHIYLWKIFMIYIYHDILLASERRYNPRKRNLLPHADTVKHSM